MLSAVSCCHPVMLYFVQLNTNTLNETKPCNKDLRKLPVPLLATHIFMSSYFPSSLDIE
jgi:hypothetical protein